MHVSSAICFEIPFSLFFVFCNALTKFAPAFCLTSIIFFFFCFPFLSFYLMLAFGLVFVSLRRAFAFNLCVCECTLPMYLDFFFWIEIFWWRQIHINTHMTCQISVFFSLRTFDWVFFGRVLPYRKHIWSFMRHMIWLPFFSSRVMYMKQPKIKMLSKFAFLQYNAIQLFWHCKLCGCHCIIAFSTSLLICWKSVIILHLTHTDR